MNLQNWQNTPLIRQKKIMPLFSLEADECFHYLLTLGIAKSCHRYLMLAMLGNLKLKSLKFACAQKWLYLCTTQVSHTCIYILIHFWPKKLCSEENQVVSMWVRHYVFLEKAASSTLWCDCLPSARHCYVCASPVHLSMTRGEDSSSSA